MIKKKIIIIDDDEVVQNFLKRVLIKSGYNVMLASNGKEALRMFSYLSVDLIMLDIVMPEMTGLELLKVIREKEITDAPVLIITGCADIGLRIECYDLGVYDFIKKPEHPEVILKRIENGLKIGDMIKYNRSIKNELLMAKRLQKYLFPDVELKTEHANIFTWSKPVTDIGGDMYDYIEFRDKRIIFYLADVSGHGVSAAIFIIMIRSIFRNSIKKTQDPGEILTIMNRELSEILPVESFVTIFCGLYDPEEKNIKYSNGGHNMPYYLSHNNLFELEGNGPFLGPVKKMKFVTYEREVKGSESLVVYTDGVLDITDAYGVPLGKKILLGILKSKDMTSYEKVNMVHNNIMDEDVIIKDDCTMLLINFK